jgi:hypothetical protein
MTAARTLSKTALRSKRIELLNVYAVAAACYLHPFSFADEGVNDHVAYS